MALLVGVLIVLQALKKILLDPLVTHWTDSAKDDAGSENLDVQEAMAGADLMCQPGLLRSAFS